MREAPTFRDCRRLQMVRRLMRDLAHAGGALPAVVPLANGHASGICANGRGGGYCCHSHTIYLCPEREWVTCETLAYELSHAVEAASGRATCIPGGITVDSGDGCGGCAVGRGGARG